MDPLEHVGATKVLRDSFHSGLMARNAVGKSVESGAAPPAPAGSLRKVIATRKLQPVAAVTFGPCSRPFDPKKETTQTKLLIVLILAHPNGFVQGEQARVDAKQFETDNQWDCWFTSFGN